MNMRFLLPLLITLLVFSVGCRRTAVTPSGGPAAAEIQQNFTVQDMREAILKGCADKNWRAAETDAQTIEATMDHGRRSVVVSIPYTASSYTINYKSSVKMSYRSKSDGGVAIHGAYNRWVKSLEQSIQAQIGKKKK